MTYEEMLSERLQALLKTVKTETTSDLLVAEYERIHKEVTQLQDERTFK